MEEQVLAVLEGRSYGRAPLLPSVRQWLDWKITNVLPHEGGTLDQDPEFMRDFRDIIHVENAFNKKEEQLRKLQQQIKNTVR